MREIARARHGDRVVSLPAMLGGEDFSAFARCAPATYIFIGSGSKGNDYPHHHPKFGLDENSFTIALQMMIDVAKNSARFRKN